MLFDRQACLVDRLSFAYQQFYPEAGFVEHDPEEIFTNTCKGLIEILEKNKLTTSDIAEEGLGPKIQGKTGLIIDPYFSAGKLR